MKSQPVSQLTCNGGQATSAVPAESNFLGGRLASYLANAWLSLHDQDYLVLEREAAYLASCARALHHGFLADMSGLLALAASCKDHERCELFLSIMLAEQGDGIWS